ncbi:HDL535Cp [Eremothecium sinecaudum]|uniref:HDL535Cp n=1 Tax=Eremothecium sinecaudum TaxID=45286 RepID=A0A0X8HRM9_9SACH|nr:HDL535Cp [Eremothecium sinecaudum]AMD20209.1 HDL535Cp [Eremothecium sinecaudum]
MAPETSGKKSTVLPVHHKETLPPQQVLDFFKIVFSDELYGTHAENLQEIIQSVKSNLFNREYIAAFDSELKRSSYCCRWSSSRAVAYSSLFASLPSIKDVLSCANLDIDQNLASSLEALSLTKDEHGKSSQNNILCIGGGAGGELIAFANLFTLSRDFSSKFKKQTSQTRKTSLYVTVMDIADWSHCISRIDEVIGTHWLHDERKYFNVNFLNNDVLTMTHDDLKLSQMDLITSLFTTNELFLENRARALRLLQSFNNHCKPGCLLLIVESAGSFSHITIGTKKFPIQFLIDTVLLGKRGEEVDGHWDLVSQDDSLWYRVDEKYDYPLKLENMRFFYRLYRKK